MRIKTVTPSFPPNIFWGEAARLVWTWWASELVCVTWVADTSSCWSILIWVAPPGEERATEHTFSNYPRFAGPAFQRGAVCEVGGWRQAVNSSYCANDSFCEAQGKGRAKGRLRKVIQRSFIDGGWWISFPWCFTLNLVASPSHHHHHPPEVS